MTAPAMPSLLPPHATAPPASATANPPAANPLAAAEARTGAIADRFRDPVTGELDVTALLAMVARLEDRLAHLAPPSDAAATSGVDDRPTLLRALGVPDSPDAYHVACPHGLFEPDAEINARLHGAGFTPEQVQLVYDLAAERLLPWVGDIAAEFEAERQIERLVAHFGGAEAWTETARQMRQWAQRNLPDQVFAALSTTYEGVLTLHHLMNSGEPTVAPHAQPPAAIDEPHLHAMMRDPKYWRDKDPAHVARVTAGYQRLYGG